MSLDLEKCSTEKLDQRRDAEEREASTCCTKIEYCIYLIIITCLLFLITLQLFTPSLTVLLVADSSLVVTIDDQQTSEILTPSYNAIAIPQQNLLHVYDLDSQKSHLIQAKVNSSKGHILKVDLKIERETVPFLDWIQNLFAD